MPQPSQTQKQPDLDESAVRNLALRRLSQSMMTEHQLREYLKRKNVDTDIVEGVVAKFISAKLIDDVAYAEMWVRTRRSIRGTGPAALRRELKLKGIAEEVILSAVAERDGDDYEIALDIASRKAASMGNLAIDAKFRRLLGFLIRRGHTASVALSVTKAVLATTAADDF